MLGFFFNRHCTRNGAAGIYQLRRAVGGSAGFTVIAILILSFTLWTGAHDVAIRQKQVFLRIKELLDGAALDVAIGIHGLIH